MKFELQAVIFDMDGVLVDSEPHWQYAELKVFRRLGIPLSEQDPLQTQGLRIDQVVAYWQRRFPHIELNQRKAADEILLEVAEQIRSCGKALPGVDKALEQIKFSERPIALATSSPTKLIDVTLEKLRLNSYFSAQVSAEFLKYGKPHPEVYLLAAEKIGVAPEHCLAIEDSLNGVLAAKAAQMKVIAVPDKHHLDDPRFAIADQCLSSLEQFQLSDWLSK